MTSVVNLSPSLQYLVDSRLDSIERALFGTNISRSERREIVQSVEDQILELLGRQGDAEPTRESVLAVLAMTDPPEAYVPPGFAPQDGERMPPSSRSVGTSSVERSSRVAPLAIISGVLGLVFCWCLLSLIDTESMPVIAMFLLAGLTAPITGFVALAQQMDDIGRSLKAVWPAIVGVCLPTATFAALFAIDTLM
jgi:hypothetical protein